MVMLDMLWNKGARKINKAASEFPFYAFDRMMELISCAKAAEMGNF